MLQDEAYAIDALVDLAPPPPSKNDLDSNNGGGGSSGTGGGPPGGGGGGFTYPPMPNPPGYSYPPGAVAYPPPVNNGPQAPGPGGVPINMSEKDLLRLNEEGPPPYFPSDPSASAPPPNTTSVSSNFQIEDPSKSVPSSSAGAPNLDLPELPTVPSDTPTHSASGSINDDIKKKDDEDEDIDFDDLTRRFEALKKKK